MTVDIDPHEWLPLAGAFCADRILLPLVTRRVLAAFGP